MAETSGPVEDVLSNDAISLEISSPAAGDHPGTAIQEYHRTEFWKKLSIGVVTPADAETVLAATKDLCRHFVSQEDGPLFVEKAAKLAAQFRNLDDGCLSELLVDQTGLQQLFNLDPDERLDISLPVPIENDDYLSAVHIPTSFSYQTLVDSEVSDARLGFWSRLFSKRTVATNRITIGTGNSPDSCLRLSFSDSVRYKKRDQRWLEAFVSSVDSLTETQALIFGPAFACPFVTLHKSIAISKVAQMLSNLGPLLKRFTPPKVARIVAGLKVQMPPLKQLTLLLSVYANVQPAQIHFNTVVGGFMYATHRQAVQLSTRFLLINLQLITVLAYHGFRTPLKLFLNRLTSWAEKQGHPGVAHSYLAFVERNFGESWRAFCRVRDEYVEVPAGAAEYDPFWRYSKAFSDAVFDELSYRRHHRVCNISTVLDLLQRPKAVQEWPILGPTYRGLLFLEGVPSSMSISGSDAEWALDTYKVLREEMRKPNENRGWYWTCCP